MSRLARLAAGFTLVAPIFAQDTSTLTVLVGDPSNAMVPGAKLVLVDTRRGAVRQGLTGESGTFIFDYLPPSTYSLEASKVGFVTQKIASIPLLVRDRQTFRFDLQVSPAASSSIQVSAEAEGVSADATAGTSLDQKYLQHLPVNGRNAESLILMAPGITSAAGGRGGAGGGFNANGLRSNANYYTLDGVSVNSSVAGGPAGGGPPGPGGGGPPPGAAAGPSTELISIDAMQEMRVQTSAFAPEFGRTPGAQVSMTSRGGTNQVRGSLFYYFRNDRLDANDWFANNSGFGRGKLRQSRPGGVLGGPILPNRTFFFASYEGLRLTAPQTTIASVPSMETRRTARPAFRPYLDAFPQPNGALLEDGAAQFRAVVSNPSTTDTGSVRIDHTINSKWTMFARYSYSPSTSEARGSDLFSPNVVLNRDGRSHTGTLSVTTQVGSAAINDLRVNFSRFSSQSQTRMDNFGGATPLSPTLVLPRGTTVEDGDFSLNALGLAGYSIASRSGNIQEQINVVNSFSKLVGTHQYKLGLDYRRIMPTNERKPYSASVTFDGLSTDEGGLLSGTALNAVVSSNLTSVYPLYTNFSAYFQDTWRASERTTLTYGARWDVNPPPKARQGPQPLARAQSTIAGVTQNEPLYNTRWFDIAPRVGLSYQIDTTQGREMVFRSGLGIFYDVGYGVSAGAFSGAPYTAQRTISESAFPIPATDLAPPALPATRPYGSITAAENDLKSPLVTQWNMTVERWFGRQQMLSVGYAGTMGRRLLRVETQPSFSDAFDILRLSTNGASSDYHGLQVQFRRRLASNVQMQLGYTYAHSIDSASNDAGFGGGGFASLFGGGERGSSDYDIRHNVNFSGSWRMPSPKFLIARQLFGGWYTDWVVTARTGLPFDVQGVSETTSEDEDDDDFPFPRGLFAQVRPDYNGLPVWIADAGVPGGKRLNKDAFESPEGFGQGNLGRNAIRGFPAWQADVSLRRDIGITERIRLNISAQAFNILNHANFANPSPFEGSNLSSPNFGVVTRMMNQGFGGGISSTYRSGGARSIELSLRLQF
ncbi:MAG: carboxypeptidase regulatory-like domain-containing protein [Bryobacteraceae bacterium]|nr:carboxypeptidase regulatory-like domain-containing protein [Bryobacteraceae bacterium]